MNPRIVFLILAAAACADTAGAHHNMTAIYKVDDVVTLSGTLTRIDWRNPQLSWRPQSAG